MWPNAYNTQGENKRNAKNDKIHYNASGFYKIVNTSKIRFPMEICWLDNICI